MTMQLGPVDVPGRAPHRLAAADGRDADEPAAGDRAVPRRSTRVRPVHRLVRHQVERARVGTDRPRRTAQGVPGQAARGRARRPRPHDRRRRARRVRRSVGLRQEHGAALRRRPGEADRRAACIIGDREVQELPPGKRDIAMVFQSYALYPHLTVYKNLAFPLKERHVPRAAARRRSAAGRRDARAHAAAAPAARAAVGRPAPTRRDGPRARARAAGLPARRAAEQPRCQAAHADAHRDRRRSTAGSASRAST